MSAESAQLAYIKEELRRLNRKLDRIAEAADYLVAWLEEGKELEKP